MKTPLKTNIVFLVLLSILAAFVSWPMLKENFITTIDGGDHLLRLYSMVQFIGKGQWYVRWIPYLHGYGYPEFNFYPPFFSFVGTALAKAGLSIIWAMNLTCVLFILFSGYTMYLLAKEFWGAHGGFLSAVAYILAPYLMVDVYLRGDYSETATFAFLPLILWAFLKLYQQPKAFYALIATLSVAGLFLTNNCVTVIFFPIIVLYIFALQWTRDRWDYRRLLMNLTILALGIGLAAFFWLPAFLEKSYVHIDKLFNGNLDFHNNFLSIRQLIHSPWPQKPGTTLPYEIGLVHCLLAGTSLCFMYKLTEEDHKRLTAPLVSLFFILTMAVFLTLPPSLSIWEHIHILQLIQFPSRFLIIITLIVSIFAGGACLIFDKHRLAIVIAGTLVLFFINFSHCSATYGFNKVNLTNITPSFIFRNLHTQDGGEFIPIWAKTIRTPTPLQSLDVLTGDSQIISRHETPETHQSFTIETLSPSLLCFNVFYFPGWTITVDGHLVDILTDNPFGLIMFPINDAGVHHINADFGPSPVRRTATIVSLMALLLLISLLIFKPFNL